MRNAMPELAVKYPGDMPLMLVIWSPEEIQALADGMEISLTGHEIRTVWHALEDIPEDQRIESGISSAAVMELSATERKPPVTVPAELLASLIQTAEQALWKREWAAGIMASPSRNASPAVRRVVNEPTLLKNNTRKRLMLSPPALRAAIQKAFHERKQHAERTDLSSRPQPAAGAGLAGRDGC